MRAWPRRSSSARCRSVVCALYVGSFLRIHSVCFTRSRATHAVLVHTLPVSPLGLPKCPHAFAPHITDTINTSRSHTRNSHAVVLSAQLLFICCLLTRERLEAAWARACAHPAGVYDTKEGSGARQAAAALPSLLSPLLSSTTTLTSPFLHIRVSSLVCCCRDAILFYSPAHLSNIKQAFVPPNPNELDMTRVTCPSWRFVKMFIPSASSTSSLIFALSARKPSRTISSE